MSSAIILLSGGLDSFVSTAVARKRHKIILALTFDYGQRAAGREISAAGKMCGRWNIPHKVIRLPWLGSITHTALVNRKKHLPASSSSSAKAVWVPNRNALFINIAASFAESLGAGLIVTGFNKEEGATFPDNSAGFVRAVNGSLRTSTLVRPRVASFVQTMTKNDMVRYAICHGLPLDGCWPCYKGGKGSAEGANHAQGSLRH